ncbi:thioredoxin family protein [Chryseobacterium nematophagum]|uniref:Thioredoxin family protein n=2 Tax=Chryseobacterium nematophagum TaxID=2305228 RepID=A0A3M7TFA2_9FLAO|nr:thioredoxin family protein [Chryseobacterium nematophagum]
MKMTKIIVVLGLLFFQWSFAQENTDVILKKAYQEANTHNKNVLVVFHASWCKWCKTMENNMNLPEVKPIFDKNFVIAYIDVQEIGDKKNLENPGGQEMITQYKGENAGLPFWLILDPKGNLITDSFDSNGDNLGSPATPEEVEAFLTKLEKSTKLSVEEQQIIQKAFEKK